MKVVGRIAIAVMVLSMFTLAQSETQAKPSVEENGAFYKLDFVLRELQDGKVQNSRNYGMIAREGRSAQNTFKIGNRVPAKVGGYLDVGVNVRCNLEPHGDGLALSLMVESSSIAPQDVASEKQSDTPILRSLRADMSTVVTLGKPTMIASLDDPISTRRVQIEVTATKLK